MADLDLKALGFTLPSVDDDLEATQDSQYADSDYYKGLSEEEKTSFNEMDEEQKSFFSRLGLKPPTASSTTEIDDDIVPVPGTGKTARDVTDEVKEIATTDSQTYDDVYDRPDNAGPAGAGLVTEGIAAVSDAVDYVTGDTENNRFQDASDEAEAAREEFLKSAQEIYEDDSLYVVENGERVFVDYYTDPETGELKERRVLVPTPDQKGALERITTNVYRGIVGQFGGAIKEGEFTGQSEFEKDYPQYDQGAGEGFVTDILEYGVPVAGLLKLGKGVGAVADAAKVSRYVPAFVRNGRIATGAAYLSNLGIAGLSDSIMAREGDEGLLISSDTVKQFGNFSDEDANDIAMFLDSMAFGGALDTAAAFVGTIGKPFARKAEGAADFMSNQRVRDKAQQSTLLSVMETLDPEIMVGSNAAIKRRLAKFSEVLNKNAFLDVSLGSVDAVIPNDTATALMQGAREYIANAHTHIRNSRNMTEQEYMRYVDEQAAVMAIKMVEISRYRAADANVINANARATAGIAEVLQTFGKQELPEGMSPDEAVKQAVNDLFDMRTRNVKSAEADVKRAEDSLQGIKDQAANIPSQIPELQELIQGVPEDTFFRSAEYVERLRNAMVDDTGKSLFNIYEQTWKGVKDAYDAVPNAPVDLERLKQELDEVFQDGILDSSGSTARNILSDIDELFKPRKSGVVEDPMPVMGQENTRVTYEDASQRIATLSEEVGFQDLLEFKRRLEKKIVDMPYGDPVRVRLEKLSRHITDSNDGQLKFVADSNGEAAAAAQNAIDTFIEAKSKFENSPPLQRFSELAATPANAGRNTMVPDGAEMRGMPELKAYSSNIDQMPAQIVADETGGYLQNLMYAAGEQGKEVVAPIQEYVEAKAVDDLVKALASGNQAKVNSIFAAIEPYRSRLEVLGSPLLQRLEEAAVSFRKLENELGSAELAGDKALEQAQQRLVAAKDTMLERFVSEYDPTNVTGDIKDQMRSIVRESDSVNAVAQMQDMIELLPEGQRQIANAAFKQASVDALVLDLFGATPISADMQSWNTKMGKLKKTLDEDGVNIIGGMQQVLKDDPVAMEGIRIALGSLMARNIPPRMKVNQAGSDTFYNQEMSDNIADSVRTGILAVFGFMNPTSAMTRQFASGRIRNLEGLAKEVGEETLAIIAANPIGFSQMVKDLEKATTPEAKKQIAGAFTTITGKGIGYQVRVDEESDVYQGSTASQMSDILSEGQRKYNEIVR